ncbi:MAG: DNA internalization-related competence protein ComEC/Rec2 [Lachnospiraceae bacterium]|nr:DNA internalization-related competence protein ComEC/Rec2 [Lachnospiraceae bacterium]
MNKRPLPCALAGFVLGEVWMWQFHGTAALAALCLAAIICFVIVVLKKGGFFMSATSQSMSLLNTLAATYNPGMRLRPLPVMVVLCAGLLAGGFRCHIWNEYKDNLNLYINDRKCIIEGQVDNMIEKEYSCSVVIDRLQINGSRQGGKLLIYLDEKPNGPIGSYMKVKGRIDSFPYPANPGGFHQKSYEEGRGVLAVVKEAELVEVRFGSFLIKDGLYKIRQKAIDYIRKHMKEEYSGIGIAMAYGEKDYLTEEQKQLYEFGGISHVLAVSGLHMSLLGAGIYKLLRKAGLGYAISVTASFPCILLYAIMSGMSSSCLRAAIMLCIYLIAELKGYYYDLPSALSFAALWLLYEIPARLFDSGFLLSFGAMISVGIICPFLFSVFQYKTGHNRLRDSMITGGLIIVFTLPLSLYFFYGFSVAGFLLNLVVIPLMTFLVPLLFAGGMGCFFLVLEPLVHIGIRLSEWILKLYDILCQTAQKFPLSYLQAGYRGPLFALAYYLFLCCGILVFYLIFKKWKKKAYFMIPVMLFCGSVFVHCTGRNDCFLTMLDVGQGDGILYHTEYGEVCMIDGGSTSERNIGQYVIRPALEYYGIQHVDYWFLSHMDEDHVSGLKELLKSGYPVNHLILPIRKEKSDKQLELEELARINNTKLFYIKQGDKVKLKDSIFYCVYPKNNNTGDENQNSMVLLLNTRHQQILLTGDVEKEGENEMIRHLKRYSMDKDKEQILKVGHHGSANGTKEELLKTFVPDAALISCEAENHYGHPAKETVQRIQKSGSKIFYTMYHGAVEIRLGKETSYLGYGMVK